MDQILLMDEDPPTNMVYVRLKDQVQLSPDEVIKQLKERDILIGRESLTQFRLVTHLWITDKDVDLVVKAFQEILA